MSPSLRRWAGRACLLLLALLASLLLAEALVRWFLPPPRHVRVEARPATPEAEGGRDLEVQGRPGGAETSLYVATPAGKRLRPNTRAVVRDHAFTGEDVEIRTNELGLRGPPLGPKEETRVLFLGDSVTMGHWQEEEGTWVRRVEILSRREGAPLQTVNAGIGGVGLSTEMALLGEIAEPVDPDIVVLAFYLNDVAPSPGVHPLKVPRVLRWSHLARHGAWVLSQWGLSSWEPWVSREEGQAWVAQVRRDFPPGPGDPVEARAAFHRAILENLGDWGSAWSDGAWERMRPLLEEFARLADTRGFRPSIVAFPVRAQVEAAFVADTPQRRLESIATDLGIPFLDLLPAHRRWYRESDAPLFHDQCHHTAMGSARVAGEILGFLRSVEAGAAADGEP